MKKLHNIKMSHHHTLTKFKFKDQTKKEEAKFRHYSGSKKGSLIKLKKLLIQLTIPIKMLTFFLINIHFSPSHKHYLFSRMVFFKKEKSHHYFNKNN